VTGWNSQQAIDAVLALGPVVAVVTLDDPSAAVPLARALVAGGVRAIEVTLRTPAALEAITRAAAVEGACVGAGTVCSPRDLEAAASAGAAFAVSPGATDVLLAAARAASFPLLPGVATASEVMSAVAAGFDRLKLFPAEAVGGPPLLKALAGPFPSVRFCPTGGITPANAPAYLALENVAAVGGSWLAPRHAIEAGDWAAIEAGARAAASLGGAMA